MNTAARLFGRLARVGAMALFAPAALALVVAAAVDDVTRARRVRARCPSCFGPITCSLCNACPCFSCVCAPWGSP